MFARMKPVLERAAGIEPATYSLGSCRSTTELRPQLLDLTRQVRSRIGPGYFLGTGVATPADTLNIKIACREPSASTQDSLGTP
jgi:hypothetical protein